MREFDNTDPKSKNTNQHHFVGRRLHGNRVRYYDMMYMNMLGMRYKDIARKTGYSHSWVKHLFARNGNIMKMARGEYKYESKTTFPKGMEWVKNYKKLSPEDLFRPVNLE